MKYQNYNIHEITDFLNQKYPFTYEDVDLVLKTKSIMLKDCNLTLSYVIPIEDEETMVVLYNNYKMPFYRIAQLYHCTEFKIRKRCTKYTNSRHKHTGVNSFNNFFNKIETPAQAYYLGL